MVTDEVLSEGYNNQETKKKKKISFIRKLIITDGVILIVKNNTHDITLGESYPIKSVKSQAIAENGAS